MLNLNNMKQTFNLEADTPWLIFGADSKKDPEFRIPSLRGIMRYWFRAVGNGFADWKKVRELESKLFGSTETASSFRLSGQVMQQTESDTKILPHKSNSTLKALFPCEVALSILFRPGTGTTEKDAINAVLKLMVLLGGIGKRSRRGLGSFVNMNGFDEKTIAKEVDEQIACIGKLFNDGVAVRSTPLQTNYPILSSTMASIWKSSWTFENEEEARRKIMEICHDKQPQARDVFGYVNGTQRLASRLHFRVHSTGEKEKREYFILTTWFRVHEDNQFEMKVKEGLKDFTPIWGIGANAEAN